MPNLRIVFVALAIFTVERVQSQELLPLDIEALYCIGAIPITKQIATEEIAKINEIMNGSGEDALKLDSEYDRSLNAAKAYIFARNIHGSNSSRSGMASAIINRGKAEAKACAEAGKSNTESNCSRKCITEDKIRTSMNEFDSNKLIKCIDMCPERIEIMIICKKPNSCRKIRDKLPL